MNNKLVGGLVALLFVVSIVNTQAILSLSNQARNQQASILNAFNSSNRDSQKIESTDKVVFGNKEIGGQCAHVKDDAFRFGTLVPTGVNKSLNCFLGLENPKSLELVSAGDRVVEPFKIAHSYTVPTDDGFPKVGEGMRYRIECRGTGIKGAIAGNMVGYVYLETPPPAEITVVDENNNITMTCTTSPA